MSPPRKRKNESNEKSVSLTTETTDEKPVTVSTTNIIRVIRKCESSDSERERRPGPLRVRGPGSQDGTLTLSYSLKVSRGGHYPWKYSRPETLDCDPILLPYTLFHEIFSTFVWNKISLPEHRNKRKSVLEITKMYYF